MISPRHSGGLRAALFLLLAFLLQETSAIRLKSKKGARVRHVEAMFHYKAMPPIPGCTKWDNLTAPAPLMANPTYAAWTGLYRTSREAYEEFKVLSKEHIKTLQYAFKRGLEDKKGGASLWSKEECIARRLIVSGTSFGDAACDCLMSLDDKKYCAARDEWAQSVYCHTEYQKKLDPDVVCPILLKRDQGVVLSQMCSGWVAGIVSSLDFNLYNLIAGDSMPGEVEEKISRQESRGYYLSWKALERFSRWTQGHMLCSERQGAADALEDIEILPTFESLLYVYYRDPEMGMIPVVMVARRPEETFLVVVRDALTTSESHMADSSTVTPKYIQNLPFRGYVHEGYANVATVVWPSVKQLLSEVFESRNNYTFPSVVTIGGGNFGSGVAAILAALIGNEFKTINGNTAVTMNSILFGAGPIGNDDFTHFLSSNVNIRNIHTEFEGLAAQPCAVSKGCDFAGSNAFYGKKGERNSFHPLPGRVKMDIENLEHDVWRSPAMQFEAVANKLCAPSCWLATKYCPDEPDPKCDVEACGVFHSANEW